VQRISVSVLQLTEEEILKHRLLLLCIFEQLIIIVESKLNINVQPYIRWRLETGAKYLQTALAIGEPQQKPHNSGRRLSKNE
jgi:hypothetical protein